MFTYEKILGVKKNKKRGERFMFLVNCIELVRGGPCRFFINEVYYNDLKEIIF